MTRIFSLALIFALGCSSDAMALTEPLELVSPDGSLRLTFRLGERKEPAFQVAYREISVASGTLGLEFKGTGPLGENLTIIGTRRTSRDETYTIPVGKSCSARDEHRELVISLEELDAPKRRVEIALRAFNNGVAFRYQIPEQELLTEFVLTEEQTRLSFPGNPKARVLPLESYTTPYEKYYETLPVTSS